MSKHLIVIGIIFIFVIFFMLVRHRYGTIQNRNDINEIYFGPHGNFSEVKVASLYENVTDGALYGRSDYDAISLLKGANTDLIFRGFWRWLPVPESPHNIPTEFLDEISKSTGLNYEQISQETEKRGYGYKQLKESIAAIKQEMPGVIFVSAIPAQRIGEIEKDDLTGEIIDRNKTWMMALDPENHGINISKIEAQKMASNAFGWRKAYYPDITNPDYQKFLLNMAKKQIRVGSDAIWIDMLFTQAVMLAKYTNDINYLAVKESFEASSKIIDEIHRYGESKGKYIYVGTWAQDVIYSPYAQPKLDFLTLSPSSDEVRKMKFNEKEWDEKAKIIRDKFGNIPVFVFIDWGATTQSQMGVFSQTLSKNQQKAFLKMADDFFAKRGMIFVYPIHGGSMG